ncbi:MAG: HDOD domain-containing protein, partial [Spirochaetes bacterium]|nr:HDOD domain-containing protein [Spirochaetota bacterium]
MIHATFSISYLGTFSIDFQKKENNMIEYTSFSNFNYDNFLNKFKIDKSINLTFPYSSHEIENIFNHVAEMILIHLGKPNLIETIRYCLKEIVMNASKANTKRLYFKKQNLNIDNSVDYEYGMKNFQVNVFTNFSDYESDHSKEGYYINIDYQVIDQIFQICTHNNSVISEIEMKRIEERLHHADQFKNMEDVMLHGFDQTEGAGFGLIIAILMLRKFGLDEKSLHFNKTNSETQVCLKIPLNLLSKEQGQKIAKEITAKIEKMPQFPESIIRLQSEVNNPNADFHSIAEIIKTDTSLTTEILRLANSPIYMPKRKIEDIEKAVTIIGLKGINNLVLNFGAQQIFTEYFDKEIVQKVMEHNYFVALYAAQIAREK